MSKNTDITVKNSELRQVGDNISAVVNEDLLILVIDLTNDIGLSSTGKMRGVASTAGFATLPGNVRGNVYVGRKV